MAEETKKVSLADAAKALLAAKQAKGKQAQAGGFGANGGQPKAMKSQNTKKVNNQRKRMGV